MATALNLASAPAAEPTLGVQLPCIRCGESDANFTLHLADGSLSCEECGADLTAEEVEALFARWRPVLAWIKAMPGGA